MSRSLIRRARSPLLVTCSTSWGERCRRWVSEEERETNRSRLTSAGPGEHALVSYILYVLGRAGAARLLLATVLDHRRRLRGSDLLNVSTLKYKIFRRE